MLVCMGKSPWWIVTIVGLLYPTEMRTFNVRSQQRDFSANGTSAPEGVDNRISTEWSDRDNKHPDPKVLKIGTKAQLNSVTNDQFYEPNDGIFVKIDDIIFTRKGLDRLSSSKGKYQNLFMPKDHYINSHKQTLHLPFQSKSKERRLRRIRSKETFIEKDGYDDSVHHLRDTKSLKIAKLSRADGFNISHQNISYETKFTSSQSSSGEKRPHNSGIRHQKSRKNFIRTRKSPRTRNANGLVPTNFPELKLLSTDDPKVVEMKQLPKERNVISTENEEVHSEIINDALYDAKRIIDVQIENGSIVAAIDDFGNNIRAKPSNNGEMDVMTKFLRIIESQHLMGDNCTKGTDVNLGEGVVDRYAQERFKLEAETAVNRANLYTRLWKYTKEQVLMSEYLLHAEVLSIIEFDEDIFAAGNCYDKYQYKDYLLFCPFAYRLPGGSILVKDLSVEYKYLSASSEWFFIARRSAERVIQNSSQFKRGYHTYKYNDTVHSKREEEEILAVTYVDGKWSKPYYDCGGGNIWMMTYTVPFFGFDNNTYHFKGTSGIDIDLRRVDIDQCPIPEGSKTLNIFADSDKCKKRTTMCASIKGLGFRRGSYKCVCKKGFYFPEIHNTKRYFNGSHIEEEYEKKMLGESFLYDTEGVFECLPCAEGCETCESPTPCVVSLNWVMRTCILAACLIIIFTLPVILFFTWKYGNLKVVRAASPVLLRLIIGGAFFIYSTTLVLYPIPSVISCTFRVWLREIGFSLAYGALMLKTWRISVIFRVRSAKAIKITDLDLMKRLGIIVGVFAVFLAIRTIVAPPRVIVSMTADDLKAFLCSTDWWDHSFTFMEMMFLVWGIRLCIVVRKAPSEFNESKFISMAIYNEFLLSLFLNVSMLFLQSPANPDLLFIIFFCHTQLTMTPLIALIFGSKVVLVIKGLGKGEDSISMTKPMTAMFLQRPKSSSQYMGSVTSTSGYNFDGDIQDELKKIYLHLDFLKERNARSGNRPMVAKIIAMQQAAQAIIPVAETVKRDANSRDRLETTMSDGVVMKPHVNNILANVTDRIVCATLQGTPNALRNTFSGECIRVDMLNETSKDPSQCSFQKLVKPSESLENDQVSLNNVHSDSDISSLFGGRRIDSLSACCSPMSYNSSVSSLNSGIFMGSRSSEETRKRNRRHSDRGDVFINNKHSSRRKCHALSSRGYRSLENLLVISTCHDTYQTLTLLQDNKFGSCHSTPCKCKRSLVDNSLQRQIKDSIRAQAFILHNLSDRNSFTDELTV